MESEGNPKLKNVLIKLLDPDFKIKEDAYLISLIDHLKKTTDITDLTYEDTYISSQFFVFWLTKAVEEWEKSIGSPHPNVLCFALNLTGQYASAEDVFVKLNCANIFERLIKTLALTQPPASVKLGYIRLLTSFLNHKSGLQWILSTNYWSKVLGLTLKCDTIYLQQEGSKFMALLLQKSVKINEMFCSNIIQIILSPLNEIAKRSEIGQEQSVYQTLCPTLNLLMQVLETLLEMNSEVLDFQVYLLFKDRFKLDACLRGILTKIKQENLAFELTKIIFILCFFEVGSKYGGMVHTSMMLTQALPLSRNLFDLFYDAADRGTVSNFLKLCYLSYSYHNFLQKKLPTCLFNDGSPVSMETQVLILQLYPVFIISLRLFGNDFDVLEEGDDVREHRINKLFRSSIHLTLRAGFKWRTYLLENFSFEHPSLALKHVLHSRKFFNKDVANTAFSLLVYSLKDIVKALKSQPEQLAVFSQESNFLCLLMETIAVIVKEFDLTWQDSLETMSVMENTFNFLSFPVWPTKLVVKGLTLLEIAISRGMSPCQALLIDSTKDNTLSLVAPMLYAKLHDGNWEVRDSALEVVRTISHNACKKFSSFSRVIIDGHFPTLTLKMATGDAEPYVRASALRCLQEMVVENEFWGNLLGEPGNNIFNQILPVLFQETEGIVRSEAAALIAKIYCSQEVPPDILGSFYNIMSHAVMVDLHWEVKVKALHFWGSVIDRHLTHQGMIDGSFPNITFSTEHRKIVTLDEKEVRKRLIKTLHQLSETGCLAVFVSALQEEYDVIVSKTANEILKKFVLLLRQYNISLSELHSDPTAEPPSPITQFSLSPFQMPRSVEPANESSPASTDDSGVMSCESVMDDILGSEDLSLLQNVFNTLDMPVANSVEVRGRQIVAPSEFVQLVFSDIEARTDGKALWIQEMDNFNSLLDDILREYVVDDVNSMDCY